MSVILKMDEKSIQPLVNHFVPTILCIEDEKMIREDIVEELQSFGFKTLEASSGIDGLQAILNDKPDLVLCDISMKGMSGFDLLNDVRTNHPELADLPFVFLSALAEQKDILAGKLMGVDDYLTKPIDYILLYATINGRLEQVRRMEVHKQEQFSKIQENLLEIFPHKLLPPLNHILVFCDLLKISNIKEKMTHEQLEYVTAIKKEGTQLQAMIKGVLSLMRASSNTLPPNKGFCSPEEAINETVSEFALDLATKKLKLFVDAPSSLPVIKADQNLFKQVISALISNAIKFTMNKGEVSVKAAFDDEKNTVKISITDSGIGIAEKDIPIALNAFTQLNSRLSRNFCGFGIGLTVANALTKSLGGTLDIESELGKFTTVTLCFPADEDIFLVELFQKERHHPNE